MQNKNILVKKIGKKGGKFFLGHILKYPPISVVLEYILIFTIIIFTVITIIFVAVTIITIIIIRVAVIVARAGH